MVKKSLVFLAVLAMVLFVQPVRAAVLYDSGIAWNNVNLGQYGISVTSPGTPSEYVTDPFTLSSASTITSINVGLYDAMVGSNHFDPSTLVYMIQDGTGAVKSSGTVGLETVLDISAGASWDFQSKFVLPGSGLDLAAGTYYLTLSNGSATNGEQIGWVYSQINNNKTSWTSRDFRTNAANVGAESFIINGTTGSVPSVPEPATMLFLGLGLIAAAVAKKRIKK
jgi:hypothetical protein